MNAISRIKGNSCRGRTEDGAPNPIDRHVGSRIKLRRTLLGKSQEQLAEALGLTFQQVQKYERGANRVGASRLFDIARALDVPVAFFYDDMDSAVAAASPAGLMAGATAPAIVADQQHSRENLELVRRFTNAPENIRRAVMALLRSVNGEG